MGLLNRIRLFTEFKKIDQHLSAHDFHEGLASYSVFNAAGWTVEVPERLEPGFGYVIYGDHRHFLDSCAANLVLPTECCCKRIVNTLVVKAVSSTRRF